MENNSVIIKNEDETILIDPSFDIELIFDEFKNDQKLIVFLTHTHYDHVGNWELIDHYAQEIYLSKNAKSIIEFLQNSPENRRLFFGKKGNLVSSKIHFVNDNDQFYGFKFHLMPGHSTDSMCIINDDLLITGDHLFLYDIGRTDLPFSDIKEMEFSLKKIRKVIENNPSKILIPGHGDYLDSKKVLEINKFL